MYILNASPFPPPTFLVYLPHAAYCRRTIFTAADTTTAALGRNPQTTT